MWEADFVKFTDADGNEKILAGPTMVVTGLTDSRRATLSTYPIESGAKVSDHFINEPDQLAIELAVSNTTLDEISGDVEWALVDLDVPKSRFKPTGLLFLTTGAGALAGAALGALGFGGDADGTKVWVLKPNKVKDRIGDYHDKLIECKQNAYLVTFTYLGRVFKDFVVTSIDMRRQAGEGSLARFTITAEQVLKVSAGFASLPNPEDLRDKPATSAGNVSASAKSTQKTVEVRSSALLKGVNGILDTAAAP
jgi:hypothetical protein